MKQFDVPVKYRSPLISAVKQRRKDEDRMKKDFTPTLLDGGDLRIYLARHFGFCYGVENAIEIAFRTIDENPGKRIFLLSEMIHNPQVNADLQEAGVRFLQDTYGRQLIPFDVLQPDDIVLIPAFGTTLDLERQLVGKGIHTEHYNTTCPFVEKVWNRSEQIARKGYSVIIHGKPKHEETRATFSHAAANAPSLILNDMKDAIDLAAFIRAEHTPAMFADRFAGMFSPGFDCTKDLQRIGVVNQTTQLASDTQAIAEYLKSVMVDHFNLTLSTVADHFADTRDTLCYATNDNQTAVTGMLEVEADLAIVVGGYNSSNTTHLVELCEQRLPTYFISDAGKIGAVGEILHYDYHTRQERLTEGFLPSGRPLTILLTSGASCPDAVVEQVINRLAELKRVEFRTPIG
ncbi:4-hydroxy-3-methylbut-2-enyl diphosphate reductase [Flavihumibacter petaseus]|uniref:4-hydroxy-3-methylbut-2-enyl diphosphate reductase n=1 Tax=Flavihumibacter petaseus NBRC 106054 TaxID=1220578 RepID=A0A0E9N798_9BACT|nr:4-hydroxy-3-methylbut-2-enyl diphosphate reductase [Flavihumibacter petaseus]GAO45704.1 4-hydroxy-3-methylbut-2-enyl diphosphate reductase [Flavihumibacter petaseus NBRC 106054]